MKKTRKRWSQTDLDQARQLYDGGLSFSQLGQRLGYSATWLARLFKTAGIPVRPSGRPYTTPGPDVDLDELRTLRQQGWSYPKLGTRYGISRDSARAHYQRLSGRASTSTEGVHRSTDSCSSFAVIAGRNEHSG